MARLRLHLRSQWHRTQLETTPAELGQTRIISHELSSQNKPPLSLVGAFQKRISKKNANRNERLSAENILIHFK
jgi:hypothetical protein